MNSAPSTLPMTIDSSVHQKLSPSVIPTNPVTRLKIVALMPNHM